MREFIVSGTLFIEGLIKAKSNDEAEIEFEIKYQEFVNGLPDWLSFDSMKIYKDRTREINL